MADNATHSELVRSCLNELALMGYAAWPNRTGAGEINGRFIRFGKYGSGDIVILLPTLVAGRLCGIHGEVECKTGNAVQKKHQKTHMRIVQNNGGVYIVARSREGLKTQMALLGYGPRETAYQSSPGPILLL